MVKAKRKDGSLPDAELAGALWVSLLATLDTVGKNQQQARRRPDADPQARRFSPSAASAPCRRCLSGRGTRSTEAERTEAERASRSRSGRLALMPEARS